MKPELFFIFVLSCGLLSLFLRKNILGIINSTLQIVLGLVALVLSISPNANQLGSLAILVFFIVAVIVFFYSIIILLIRRRSTMNINELTELRG